VLVRFFIDIAHPAGLIAGDFDVRCLIVYRNFYNSQNLRGKRWNY
jgi:hypothetical protein